MASPSVTCILVATPGRPRDVAAAIADFAAQAYANARLVVVADDLPAGGDPAGNVVVVPRPAGGLAAARNAGLDLAGRGLACLWDDDVRHHPLRLAAQVAAVGPGDAGSGLGEVLHLARGGGEIRWVDHVLGPLRGIDPSTLLAWATPKARYVDRGDDRRAADVAYFWAVAGAAPVSAVRGRPALILRAATAAAAASCRGTARGPGREELRRRSTGLGRDLAQFAGSPSAATLIDAAGGTVCPLVIGGRA